MCFRCFISKGLLSSHQVPTEYKGYIHSDFSILNNFSIIGFLHRIKIKNRILKKWFPWTSQVGQWLRICLLIQGHRFEPWSGEILHAMGQLNPWATTTEACALEPTHYKTSHSIRSPWAEEPGGLWSIESQRVWHDWSNLAYTQHNSKRAAPICHIESPPEAMGPQSSQIYK